MAYRTAELFAIVRQVANNAREQGRAEGLAQAGGGMSVPPALADDLAALMMARQIVDLERRLAGAPDGSRKDRLARDLDQALKFQDKLTERRMRQSEAETERQANAAMRVALARVAG